MQIQIVSVSKPEWKEKAGSKAKWQEITLTYVSGGKTSAKKILSFSPVFTAMKEAEGGDQFDIEMVKEGDFWNWMKATKVDTAAAPFAVDAPKQVTRPSTYETAEERAKKQVYIIRQSSLANAISLLAANGGKKNTVEEVIVTAQQLADFVFGVEVESKSVFDMEDDLPA